MYLWSRPLALISCVALSLALVGTALQVAAQVTPWGPSGPDGRTRPDASGRRLSAGARVGPIQFDEPEIPLGAVVSGLTITRLEDSRILPLSFVFTVDELPSASATITTTGPPSQTFVLAPFIEGDALGRLQIDLGAPVDQFGFSFALSCSPPAPAAVTVTLRDSMGNFAGSFVVDAVDTGAAFAENEVSVGSPTPVRSLDLVFDDDQGRCVRFVFDRLRYDLSHVVYAPAIARP